MIPSEADVKENGVSINARCLNDFNIEFFEVEKFDGQNWEQSIEKLKKFD